MQSSPFLRIGSRSSNLALVQARLVQKLLAEAHDMPLDAIEIRTITTSGDTLKDAPLSEVGGKGLFSREIEAALEAGEIDLGVHSSKDMATKLPDGLVLAAFLEREDIRDAFVSLKVNALDDLPQGAKLGSSSLRRASQMLRARPDLTIVPFRGNVDTRLRKLADGVADATLLAVAGLNRLGRQGDITAYLDSERFPPAPAQGAIGLEIRANDRRTADLIAPLNHGPTATAVHAERALLAALDGSCRTAIGVVSHIADRTILLRGEILSPDGQIAIEARHAGPAAAPEAVGHELGQILRDKAGSDFLKLFPDNGQMVRLLVTRPEPDASETAARLRALDIDAVVEPLLFAQTLTTTLPAADGFAALAITSANALRALEERGDIARLLALPVYTVGDRSAAVARRMGFAQVVSAAGDVDDLIALLANAGVDGPVLYPTARQHAGDLARALAPHGVMVITTAVYEMTPASALRADLTALDGALFYSRRTAETFVHLAPAATIRARPGMLCLSEAVAEPLIAAHFVRVSLADHPSEEAMMALALSFARDQKMGMIE